MEPEFAAAPSTSIPPQSLHLDTETCSNTSVNHPKLSRPALRRTFSKSPHQARRPRQSIFREIDVDGTAGKRRDSIYPASAMPTDMMEGEYYSFDGYGSRQEKDSPTHYLGEETELVLPRRSPILFRLSLLAFMMLVSIPLLFDMPLIGKPGASMVGAKAGVMGRSGVGGTSTRTGAIGKRSDTSTDVCNRWAHASALINGTIYVYGGHATTQQDQGPTGSWTNDFFTMDMTKNVDISKPALKGLSQPSGPPAVANHYLWQSYDTLYLYGGLVSDSPRAYPQPYSLWAYDIPSSQWTEHKNPKTSSGNNSDPGNQPVQQAAEGAGVSVPELGRGYYFAGHLDAYTTPNWPLPIPRQYLKSMIEYTFPGYGNTGVQSLSGGQKAGSDGVWRNITQGGIQDTNTFTIRADSALVHVPGFGDQGILLSLGGGTNQSFVSSL